MISKCLKMFQCNLDEFLRRFIIVDDMDPLLHTRDEGTVKIIDFIGLTSSEKMKTIKSGRKGDTIFWDVRSIIHINYRPSVEANDQW